MCHSTARKARLDDVLEDIGTKKLIYLYDFGDGWEHTIKVERLADPAPGALYPRLIEIQSTSATPSSQSGSATTSIPTPTKPSGSLPKSMHSPGNGRASPSAPAALDPRPSPEGFVLPVPIARA
jgi:Plasmid pRiA4b ORF-3-like protein